MDFLKSLPVHTAESVYDASLLIKPRDKDAREVRMCVCCVVYVKHALCVDAPLRR